MSPTRGFCINTVNTCEQYCMYSGIFDRSLHKYWDFATGTREKSYMYKGDLPTEAHQNIVLLWDLAVGAREKPYTY